MMMKYFTILFQEMKIVYQKHGLVKAGFSGAFFTDFVPGIVMSVVFGQLGLLALPVRAVLGDEYSADSVASQYEEAILVTSEAWEDLEDENIFGTQIVEGLYMLKLPSLGHLTDAIISIACGTENNKLLTVSSHTEIQMRVSTPGENAEKMKLTLGQEHGVELMFDYKLPETGAEESSRRQLCLCVQIPNILEIVRKIGKTEPYKEQLQIEQIYDFWG